MHALRVAVAALLIAAGVAAPTVIGAIAPGYDPRSDFLSELGQKGAPYAVAMNFGVFLPAGLLWTLGSALVWRALPRGWLGATGAILLFGNAVSYVGVALFPCDAGCPATGTFSQAMHNYSGAIGYLLTPLSLALLGAHLLGKRQSALGGVTLFVAALTGVAFAQMLSDLEGAEVGVWQRCADFAPFFWMAGALVALQKA